MGKSSRQSLTEEVMNKPLSLSGFNWSYGFVSKRFAEQKIDARAQNLCIIPALDRGMDKHLPDTREILEADAVRLWNAISNGDIATIDSLVNEWWEFTIRLPKEVC